MFLDTCNLFLTHEFWGSIILLYVGSLIFTAIDVKFIDQNLFSPSSTIGILIISPIFFLLAFPTYYAQSFNEIKTTSHLVASRVRLINTSVVIVVFLVICLLLAHWSYIALAMWSIITSVLFIWSIKVKNEVDNKRFNSLKNIFFCDTGN